MALRQYRPATPAARSAPVIAVRASVADDDDGIHRGDVLLVRREAAAAAGSTVVAVVDGRLRVRRLVRGAHGERQLVPVSPHVLPLVLPAERAEILGPLVGVVRRRRPREATPPSPRPSAESVPAPDSDLAMMGDALDDAALRLASNRGGPRLHDLARDLRALRDCYVRTSVPKLRRALAREARACIDALHRMLRARASRRA